MVKAKDFWEYLCNGLDYRFFAGVPCKGLNFLYSTMSSEFLHYVPAVTEQIAVSFVNGANLAGLNSAVLMSAEEVNKLDLDFNKENTRPLFIIASGNNKPKGIYSLELTEDLEGCLNKMVKRDKPGVLFIREETE